MQSGKVTESGLRQLEQQIAKQSQMENPFLLSPDLPNPAKEKGAGSGGDQKKTPALLPAVKEQGSHDNAAAVQQNYFVRQKAGADKKIDEKRKSWVPYEEPAKPLNQTQTVKGSGKQGGEGSTAVKA